MILSPLDIAVFLGPSLERDTAREILPAVYLAPAGCGDLLASRRLHPKVVALVDGVFEHRPSVWHKEILYLLEQGVRVVGAASIGALRAAELHRFGMIGIGSIFEEYRDGLRRDDADVAVLHGGQREAWRALTDPLVNVEATLSRAAPKALGESMAALARRLFYQERTWEALFRLAEETFPGQVGEIRCLSTLVENGGRVDRKREDAIQLLETLSRVVRGESELPVPVPFRLERTTWLRGLLREVDCRPLTGPNPGSSCAERVAQAARLAGPFTYRAGCLLARFLGCFQALAAQEGLQPNPIDVPPGWAEANDLEGCGLEAFQRRVGLALSALARWEGRARRSQDDSLLLLLKIEGLYCRFRGRSSGESASRFLRSHAFPGLMNLLARCLRALDGWLATEARMSWGPGSIQLRSDRFRAARGLSSAEQTWRWMQDNDLDLEGFQSLVEMLVGVRAACYWDDPCLGGLVEEACWIHDALRLGQLYAPLKARLAQAAPSQEPADQLVQRYFSSLGEPVPSDLDAYARGLDFEEGRQGLLRALAELGSEWDLDPEGRISGRA
ncbi:MAG: hypothetical protein HY319_15070 [Armatimonadetes bacterium]|nr:hypothetical protein [Armatimonadota bacterium]